MPSLSSSVVFGGGHEAAAMSRLQPAFQSSILSTTPSEQQCQQPEQQPQQPTPPTSKHPFLCGWGAGCIETCILYPVVKLIFRQQLHGIVLKEAFQQVVNEGFPRLYRGLLPPLIQRTTTRSVMFGMYDSYKHLFGCETKMLKDGSSPRLAPQGFSLCHSGAAFLAGATEAVLCPFERVQVLLQTSAYHSHFRNTHDAFKAARLLGLHELYRGLSVIVVRNGGANCLYFGLREPLKEAVMEFSHLWHRPHWANQWAAHEVDATTADSSTPTEINPKTTSQQSPVHSNEDNQGKAREEHSQFTHMVADFISGALLGASINTVFFPLNVVKQRMQSQLGTRFESPWRVLAIVWRERDKSLRGLYRGVQLNFTRSVLTWGITNSVYEMLRRLLA